MTKRKFKKIVSEYFEIEKIEKIGKKWFSAWGKPKCDYALDTPNYQIQFKRNLWFVGGIVDFSLKVAYIKWLESNRQFLDERINDLKREVNLFNWYIDKLLLKDIVRFKRTTLVYFTNGDKVQLRRCKGDKDDVYDAVAYAIARQLYKTNSRYKRTVDKLVRKGEC
jgi:hypothetical protein